MSSTGRSAMARLFPARIAAPLSVPVAFDAFVPEPWVSSVRSINDAKVSYILSR